MPLKLTLRRNGHHHAKITIMFHPGRTVAVNALAYHRENVLFDEAEPRATKKMVEEVLRSGYANHGEGLELFLNDSLADSDYGDELVAWADSEIKRLYPEWS